MTPKQARFVEEYLLDLNATQAAIRAGYSAKTAASIGERLLRNVDIQIAIQKKQRERSQQTGIEANRVLLEIARLAFNDPRKAFDHNNALLPIQEWPDEVAAAISAIKIVEMTDSDGNITGETKEIKFWDKTKNLDMASRHLGLYNADQTQKTEIHLTGFRMVES